MKLLVYYSSASENTHRFVVKSGLNAIRIPISPKDDMPAVREPFILIVPTFAGDDGQGAVPKQVIRFLNDPDNRQHICGVIGAGNRNFGKFYAYAGDVVSARCKVPYLYRFELAGTDEDVENVKKGIASL